MPPPNRRLRGCGAPRTLDPFTEAVISVKATVIRQFVEGAEPEEREAAALAGAESACHICHRAYYAAAAAEGSTSERIVVFRREAEKFLASPAASRGRIKLSDPSLERQAEMAITCFAEAGGLDWSDAFADRLRSGYEASIDIAVQYAPGERGLAGLRFLGPLTENEVKKVVARWEKGGGKLLPNPPKPMPPPETDWLVQIVMDNLDSLTPQTLLASLRSIAPEVPAGARRTRRPAQRLIVTAEIIAQVGTREARSLAPTPELIRWAHQSAQSLLDDETGDADDPKTPEDVPDEVFASPDQLEEWNRFAVGSAVEAICRGVLSLQRIGRHLSDDVELAAWIGSVAELKEPFREAAQAGNLRTGAFVDLRPPIHKRELQPWFRNFCTNNSRTIFGLYITTVYSAAGGFSWLGTARG